MSKAGSFFGRLYDWAGPDGDSEEFIFSVLGKYSAIGFGILGALSGIIVGFNGAGVGGALLGALLGGVGGLVVGFLLGVICGSTLKFAIVWAPIILPIAALATLVSLLWGVGK